MSRGRTLSAVGAAILPAESCSFHLYRLIPFALQHHIMSQSPSRGQAIHSHIIKAGLRPGTNVSIKFVILYLKCNCLKYARQVFDEMPDRTVSAYSYMAFGYFKHGLTGEFLCLVRGIEFVDEKPYMFILSMILKLSAILSSTDIAKQVHNQVVKLTCKFDEVLHTALIDSYSKNGKMEYARSVFENLMARNFICATALITGYMNGGSVGKAEEVFKNIRDKDIVVFNAMIEGYSKKAETALKALEMYKDMQCLGYWPTISTFASIIGACSILSALEFGKQVHCQLTKIDLFSHIKSGSALIDMYNKCAQPEDARRLFESLPKKNVVTWTTMIDGYGKNGNSREALKLFYDMLGDSSVKPNHVTFLSALSACGHTGRLLDGKKIFQIMERDHLIKPRMEHYACMVDIIGRAGCLVEAFEFIKQIPDKPNSDVWAALLGACRLHGHVELAAIAANEVFELSHDRRPGAYVSLSNSFAAAGKWQCVAEVRKLMKEKGVAKDTAHSWIDTDAMLSSQGIKVI